jgi:inosose dehydratase
MTGLFSPYDVLVGANPIIWSNDDFAELNGDLPLDTLLTEMRAAGYAGTELGHAYSRQPDALAGQLARHGLRLVSGWHSTYFASRDWAEEERGLRDHLRLLKTLGARVAIVAECTHAIHGDRERPLGFDPGDRPVLTPAEWQAFTAGLTRACRIAATEEMRLVYHHHVGTVVQAADELDRLLWDVPDLWLLLDPGHLALAGIDPLTVVRRYRARLAHVHLKSVRADVAKRVRQERWSFYQAVRAGVFTIPGDGAVDFRTVLGALAEADYRGWLVVEAEEDPAIAPPLAKARRAREFLRSLIGH